MKLKRLLFLIILAQFFQIAYSQQNSKYPLDYFRSPIDGRIFLSGTFGELRNNHFHAGIDIKTGGSEGKNVYAAADGWVSRIKISPWGYGHAVYIEHPNGFTSVYGHLKELNGDMADYLKKQQYQKQSFDVDLYLPSGQFPVKKGDIIALSGNTGGSGGPHLHFEIRETASQEPINPLLFGIDVKDFVTPQILGLRIYPAEKGALIQGKNKAKNFDLKGWGKDYKLKDGDSIRITGDFYLGLNAFDKQNDSENKNGVYQIEVYADSLLVYSHNVERINFSTTRYINALIDHEYFSKNKSRYQRTYMCPNNMLDLYEKVKNRGIFSLNDNHYHPIKYVVKDAAGNFSELNFTILSIPLAEKNELSFSNLYQPLNENIYNDEFMQINIPSKALYDTLTFHTKINSQQKTSVSQTYQIGNSDVALQKNIEVKLKKILIADNYKKKAYLGQIDGKDISAISAEWSGDDLSFKTKSFGTFAVFVDTLSPSIQLRTKFDAKKPISEIAFTVSDKQSGIAKYNAWLNGSWVLLEWDPKTSKMFYKVDSLLLEKNTLKLIVVDEVGNEEIKTIHF